MIIKHNNSEGAVFDVFQRPKGKRQFVNRRKLGVVARPILAGKHLPVQSFGRSKRCYCSRLDELFRSGFVKRPRVIYEPLHHFYLYSEGFVEAASSGLSLRSSVEALELCVNLELQALPEGAEKFSDNEQPFESLEHKISLASEGTRFAVSLAEKGYASLIYETTKTSEIFVKAKIGEAQWPYKMRWQAALREAIGPCLEKTHPQELAYAEPQPIKALLLPSCKGFGPQDYTYAVEPEEGYCFNAKHRAKGLETKIIMSLPRDNHEILIRPLSIQPPALEGRAIKIASSKTKKLKSRQLKYQGQLAIASKALGAHPVNSRMQWALPMSFVSAHFKPMTKGFEALAIIKLENKKRAVTAKKAQGFTGLTSITRDLRGISIAEAKKYSASFLDKEFSFNYLEKLLRLVTKEPSKKLAEGLVGFNIARSLTVKKDFTHEFKKPLQGLATLEKKEAYYFKTKEHAQYSLKRLKVIKAPSIKKQILDKMPINAYSPKKKTLISNKSYPYRFTDIHKKNILIEPKIYLRRLINKPILKDITLVSRVRAIKQSFPIKIREAQAKQSRPLNILDEIVYTPWILKDTSFRRISKIRFIKRPFKLIVLSIARFKALPKNLSAPYYSELKGKQKNNITEPAIKINNNFAFTAQRLKMQIMAERKDFASFFKAKPIDLSSPRNFIKANEDEIKDKIPSFRARLMPYSFGFPSFVYMPEQYKQLINIIFLQINKDLSQTNNTKGGFRLGRERVYRNPYSLKEPKLFILAEASINADAKDYFAVKPPQKTAQFSLKKPSAFKQAWQKGHYLKTIAMKPMFVAEGAQSINLQKESKAITLEGALYREKKIDAVEIKGLVLNRFKISSLEKQKSNNESKAALKGLFSIAGFGESLVYTGFKEFLAYGFSIPDFKQKLSKRKDYFLPISEARFLSITKQSINKATYRSFRFAYRPTFSEATGIAQARLGHRELDSVEASVKLFPKIKIKSMQIGSFSMAPPIEQAFMKRAYKKEEPVEAVLPSKFGFSEAGLPELDYIGLAGAKRALLGARRQNFEYADFCLARFFRHLKDGCRFLGVNYEYLYAYLPKERFVREKKHSFSALKGDEALRLGCNEGLEIGLAMKLEAVAKKDFEWSLGQGASGSKAWAKLEQLEISGQAVASAKDDTRLELSLMGTARQQLEGLEYERCPKRLEADYVALKSSASCAQGFEVNFGGAGHGVVYIDTKKEKPMKELERKKGFDLAGEVEFRPLKYLGLNYNEGQTLENDVIYKSFVILYRPAFIPDWVDLFAGGPRKNLELKA